LFDVLVSIKNIRRENKKVNHPPMDLVKNNERQLGNIQKIVMKKRRSFFCFILEVIIPKQIIITITR
jgi:hypothetical protein